MALNAFEATLLARRGRVVESAQAAVEQDHIESELQRIESYFGTTKLDEIGSEDDQDPWGDLLLELQALLIDDIDDEAAFERFQNAVAESKASTIRELFEELLPMFTDQMPATTNHSELREMVAAAVDLYIEESTHEGQPISFDDFILYLAYARDDVDLKAMTDHDLAGLATIVDLDLRSAESLHSDGAITREELRWMQSDAERVRNELIRREEN